MKLDEHLRVSAGSIPAANTQLERNYKGRVRQALPVLAQNEFYDCKAVIGDPCGPHPTDKLGWQALRGMAGELASNYLTTAGELLELSNWVIN